MNNDTKLMVVTKPIVTLYSEDGKDGDSVKYIYYQIHEV